MKMVPLPLLEGDRFTPLPATPIMEGKEELLNERRLQLESVSGAEFLRCLHW